MHAILFDFWPLYIKYIHTYVYGITSMGTFAGDMYISAGKCIKSLAH